MSGLPEPVGASPSDESIDAIFGDAMPMAQQYADLLRGDGVAHGHLGPREAERVWQRHLLNCAVVTDLVPQDSRVVDVGSGAGLPGLPMAIRRPDLRMTLVEPMQRRIDFLIRCVEELGLGDRIEVVRGRAGDPDTTSRVGTSRYVTARAVAPLDRLVGWCLSLLTEDGVLLALKGERAQDEVNEHRLVLRAAGLSVRSVEQLPAGTGVTRVVVLDRVVGPKSAGAPQRGRRGGR